MKNRIVLDLSIFNSILRELKAIRKELRVIKGDTEKKPVPKRILTDGITTKEVLHLLKITPATLISYEKLGLLKYHVEGRNKIYSESEVRNFKKSRGRRKRLSRTLIKKVKSAQV
jgi:hypothetical protein